MRSQGEGRLPLPSRLTAAEREFYTELRRLVDLSPLSAGEPARTRSSQEQSAWEGWLNGRSLPPQQAIKELASKLTGNGVDASRLTDLWARAFLPTPYPTQPGQSLMRPRQLPFEKGMFTGRAEELKVLGDLARQIAATGGAGNSTESGGTDAAVIVIEGPAGIGKTALATQVAHQVSGLFPDGQLWVGLRGSGDADEPVTDQEAVRGFLEAFGVAPSELPFDADEEAALYRRLMAGRHVLVVLDNAGDADQVRRLLPDSRNCLVLITTRSLPLDLFGAAAHTVRLGPLSDSEARELLERRLGDARLRSEPSAADELVRLCGRLPLVLSVAAARAAANPDLPLRALAGELRPGGHDSDAPVVAARTVFDASYAHLSDAAARMFRLLSCCPGPDIGLPAAASLAAIPANEARTVLGELTARYLVEEHQPGRYAVHDLLHAYALEQAQTSESAAELDAATERLLDHYLRGMHAATTLIYPARYAVPLVPPVAGVQAESFSSAAQALAWCHAERTAARSLVTHAARHGGFSAYCWQLPWAMAPVLKRGAFLADYLATQRIAITAARGLGDPFGQGIANYEYAHACSLIGKVGESDTHLTASLDFFTRAGDQAAAARALNGMAQRLIQDGEYPRALERETEALELRRGVGEPDPIAHSEQTLGFICARLGRHEEAVRHCQRALDISRETGNRAHTADTLAVLGFVQRSLGDHARAVACYMEVLVIYREIGDRISTAEALTGLGDAQHAQGDERAARATWRQALAILNDLPNADIQPIRARLTGFS